MIEINERSAENTILMECNNRIPRIDMTATGANIERIRTERGLTVNHIQQFFGFATPQAIYKWQAGRSLPNIDNLVALSILFGVAMDEIIVVEI